MKQKISLDSESEIVSKVSKKIQHFTGLNVKFSEPMVVQNYGVGGVARLHSDHFTTYSANYTEKVKDGNRIASVILYVS
jgi:CRISPR/Cas system-associated protein Csx1